jgi:23S rRNA (uridine2552-2'-O)-methyltransferase
MPKPYIPNDKWARRAASEGYRARSVYKLMELDARFHLLHPGMTVLDLGAAPGSWLQYEAERIGPKGKAVGFDVQEIAPVADNVSVHLQDITDHALMRTLLEREGVTVADLVLSDIAPNTSGIKDVDQWRSLELGRAVFAVADAFLKRGGCCVVKIFRGADFDEFLAEVRRSWTRIRLATVEASRDRSREVYMVATKP